MICVNKNVTRNSNSNYSTSTSNYYYYHYYYHYYYRCYYMTTKKKTLTTKMTKMLKKKKKKCYYSSYYSSYCCCCCCSASSSPRALYPLSSSTRRLVFSSRRIAAPRSSRISQTLETSSRFASAFHFSIVSSRTSRRLPALTRTRTSSVRRKNTSDTSDWRSFPSLARGCLLYVSPK